MADATVLIIHAIGNVEPDDLPAGPCVVLTGSLDAVKAAARLFGQEVRLVAAALQVKEGRE